jgi:hypothetical protein
MRDHVERRLSNSCSDHSGSTGNLHEADEVDTSKSRIALNSDDSKNDVIMNDSDHSSKGAIKPQPSTPSFISTLMSTGKTFRYLFVYAYSCVCKHMHIYMHICIYVHIYIIHIYMYIYIFIYIHIYMYTYMYT